MKRKISILAAFLLAFSLAGCGNTETPASNESAQTETTESVQEAAAENYTEEAPENNTEETDNNQAHGDVLVVYFSATGTTRGVAEKIASVEDADIYEIIPAESYSDADLNWNDSDSRSTVEQNDPDVRPEISSDALSLDGYKTVYIGYPIWWGEEPRIMDTFVEKYSFDGITMIPFCTSSSSGIGRSGHNLADNAGSGTWLDGQRFGAGASEEDVRSWIESLR